MFYVPGVGTVQPEKPAAKNKNKTNHFYKNNNSKIKK